MKPMAPSQTMARIASQTAGFSGRAQSSVEITTAPSSSTPPIVGVPRFPPCNSESLWTSAAVRIGWPTFNEINLRIT